MAKNLSVPILPAEMLVSSFAIALTARSLLPSETFENATSMVTARVERMMMNQGQKKMVSQMKGKAKMLPTRKLCHLK